MALLPLVAGGHHLENQSLLLGTICIDLRTVAAGKQGEVVGSYALHMKNIMEFFYLCYVFLNQPRHAYI